MENYLLVGQDSYPEMIGDATHLLTNWKASTAPPPATNDRSRRTQGAPPAITFACGETRPRPGESTVRGTWADPIPLPANDDFSSALAGFDPTRPTLAPSKKHPYNISAEIECVKCKKMGHYATACCPFIVAAFVRPSVQLNQSQNPEYSPPRQHHC